MNQLDQMLWGRLFDDPGRLMQPQSTLLEKGNGTRWNTHLYCKSCCVCDFSSICYSSGCYFNKYSSKTNI